MSLSRWAATATVAAVLAALAAIGGAAAQQKVLRVVPHADLKVLDGYQTTAFITAMHMGAVYDTLFSWDEKMSPKPQMVQNYTVSPDKLKYTFTLRPGLKFHDGSPVTTKDVVPSIKRMLVLETLGKTLAGFVASVDAVDANTFTLTMKEPFGFTEFSLSGSNNLIGILREKEATADYKAPLTEIVGSGPFRFVRSEWVPGSKVVYEKNPDYVPRSEPPSGLSGGKVVKVDRVEYQVIPDQATAANALKRGEVDFFDGVQNDLVPTLEGHPDIEIGSIFTLQWQGLIRPNHLHPPFNNAKARQALAKMVDQNEYGAAAFGSEKFRKPCFAFWICDGPFGTSAGSEPYRKQDVEGAKQLLKEAGYNGEKIVLVASGDLPALKALALVTEANLKKIGMNVELQMMDWGGVVTRRASKEVPAQGGWHLFHTGHGTATAASPLSSLVTPTSCDGAWFGWPCDEVAEKLRQQFIRETDSAKQQQIAETLHKRLWEIIPYVPVSQYDQPYPWRKNIKGVLKAPTIVWWNIEKL
jgi:peptide/nickel transport system substrate-binding protein